MYLISFAVTGADSVPYKNEQSPCVLYFNMEPTIGPRLSPIAKSLPIHNTTGNSSSLCDSFFLLREGSRRNLSTAIAVPSAASLLKRLKQYSIKGLLKTFTIGKIIALFPPVIPPSVEFFRRGAQRLEFHENICYNK